EERFTVLSKSTFLPQENASGLFDASRTDVEGIVRKEREGRLSAEDHDAWVALMSGTVRMLYRCKDQPWVADALGRTFDSNGYSLWRGQTDFVDGAGQDADGTVMLQWVANSLDEATYQRLLQNKALPKNIIAMREIAHKSN